MAEDEESASGQGDAARAFEDLRAEVSVLRRAVEALPDHWKANRPPDYTPSLGVITRGLLGATERLQALEQQPALRMTPELYRQEMARAGQSLVGDAVNRLNAATRATAETQHALAAMIGSARTQERQWKWAAGTGLAAFVIGIVLSPMLASCLPFGLDARVAAVILRADRWQAGIALMRSTNPEGWAVLAKEIHVAEANHDTLNTCRAAAAKAKKEQVCSIVVPAP